MTLLCAVQVKKVQKQVKKAKPGTQTIKRAQAPIRKAAPKPGRQSNEDVGSGVFRYPAQLHFLSCSLAVHPFPNFPVHLQSLWLPNADRPAWLDGSMPGEPGST